METSKWIPKRTAATQQSSPEHRWRCGDSSKRELKQTPLPLAEVVRFTGRSRFELLDLVRAGVLDEVLGRGACKLTASSLCSWVTAGA